jgi:hypothetical protein
MTVFVVVSPGRKERRNGHSSQSVFFSQKARKQEKALPFSQGTDLSMKEIFALSNRKVSIPFYDERRVVECILFYSLTKTHTRSLAPWR